MESGLAVTNSNSNRTAERFRFFILLMQASGIPIFLEKESILFKAYKIMLLTCLYATFLSIWLRVFHVIYVRDLKDMMTVFRQAIAFMFIMFLDLYYRSHTKEFEHLIQLTESFIWEDMPLKDQETGKLTSAGIANTLPKYIKNILLVHLIFHAIQSTYRMIALRDMMLPSLFPYDIKASPAFELTYIVQVIALIPMVSDFYIFFGLYFNLVIIGCSQFDKINMNLLTIKEGGYSTNENNEILKICICQHQQTLTYLDEMEKLYSILLCGTLLMQIISICLIAFSLMVNWGDYADTAQSAVLYVIVTSTSFLVCCTGNELTDKSDSVKEAAYSSDWVGAPISFQKSILLIMNRANSEFTFTAGKFVPVNNSTLMNVLNESLSLFMFLLNVQEQRNAT